MHLLLNTPHGYIVNPAINDVVHGGYRSVSAMMDMKRR